MLKATDAAGLQMASRLCQGGHSDLMRDE